MNEKRQFRFMDSDHGGDGERKTETVTFTFYDGKMELNDKAVYQVEYIPGYKKNKVYHASLNIHYDKTENCGWPLAVRARKRANATLPLRKTLHFPQAQRCLADLPSVRVQKSARARSF